MYFDIYKSTSNSPQKYWWVARGDNHETMCSSELLSSKQNCLNAIRVIRSGVASAPVYDETGEVRGDVNARRIWS